MSDHQADETHPEPHFKRAHAEHQAGRLDSATDGYKKVLELVPDHFDALQMLGLVAFQQGRIEQGIKLVLDAIAVRPDQFGPYANLSKAYQMQGKLVDALQAIDHAISLKPDNALNHSNRAVLLRDMQRHEASLASSERAIQLDDKMLEAHFSRILALMELGRHSEALEHCDRLLTLHPGQARAHGLRGLILMRLIDSFGNGNDKENDTVIAAHDKAISLQPNDARLHHNRASTLCDFRRYDAALASIDTALRIDPKCASAHAMRDVILQNLGRFDEALASHDQALKLDPDSVKGYDDRGFRVGEKRMIAESIDSYRHSLRLDPENAETHRNLGIALLLKGDFQEGWNHYEWRLKLPAYQEKERSFHQPVWSGDTDLKGKTILLYAEQGFGDTIQFCRYAPLVAALGARVILQAPLPLLPLLSSLPDVLTIGEGMPLPTCDFRCSLMSLPRRFLTGRGDIPSQANYLSPNSAKRDYWQRKLGVRTLPRIGLVWSGNPNHRNDHNRSMPLQGLLGAIPEGFDLFSLQKQVRDDDMATIAQRTSFRHFGDDLQDFADTAALASLMDVVITVDTSVAHLAGALGIPTWIMLPYVPDWRWMLDRNDSPWYPSARLFRQATAGNWSSVLAAISRRLTTLERKAIQ